jgi:peptide/nickel transport system permease protein
MTAFLLRRFFQSLAVIFVTSIAIFLLLYLAPGGPMSEILELRRQSGSRFPVKPEDLERLKRQYDLDLPVWQSYTRWAVGWPDLPDRPSRGGIIRGDLGVSWRISQNEPTTAVIGRVLPNTLILMTGATLFSLLIAIPIGIYSAVHQYSKVDYAVTTGAFFGTAMPVFWLGSMLILLFAIKFRDWGLPYLPTGGVAGSRDYTLPLFGRIDAGGGFDRFLRLIMPTVTLSLLSLATWSRFTRASMLEVLRQDYVRTARAKGLVERVVILKHTLRNALIPLITIVTLQIPGLFGGAILTETTFNYRGMGLLLIDSLFQSDWPVAMAYLMIQSALIVAANLLADVLYTVVDPRIRYS